MVVSTTGSQTGKALSQFISDIETGGNNNNDLTPGTLPEGTLAHKFNFIASQSVNDVLYDIVIDNNIVHLSDFNGVDYTAAISTKGRNVVIHIHSDSPNDIKTITLGGRNNLFDIKSNITIRLSNIILKGVSNNIYPLLYVDSGAKLIIEDGTLITGNTSTTNKTLSSGIQVVNGGILIMNSGEISGHKSTGNNAGGAVGLYKASFIMNGGIITGNEATNSDGVGGGIYFLDNSFFTMNGGEITNNKAEYGGGIYFLDNSSFTMNGGKISGNSVKFLGGGIGYEGNSSFVMNDGEIRNNNSENAGGIIIFETGTFTMSGGIIKGNSASNTGGGIYALDTTLTMNGGESRINVSITGGEIIGNSAKYGGGIALYNSHITKTGGYIAGTDSGINANVSTQNQGDAILYCRDYIFWDRKLSLTQNDNISTDNLDNGWTYLGEEGDF
jgi:hypothetical protein